MNINHNESVNKTKSSLSVANVQSLKKIPAKLIHNVIVCKSEEDKNYDEHFKIESRSKENEIFITDKSEGVPETNACEQGTALVDPLNIDDDDDEDEETRQLRAHKIYTEIFCPSSCMTVSFVHKLSATNPITQSTKARLEEKNFNIRQICFPPPTVIKSTPTKPPMRTQTQFDTNVFKYFLRSLTPFSLVESPEFWAMFPHSDVEMPRTSEEDLYTQIEIKFKEVKNKIITLLEVVDFICIAIDLWSSKSHIFLAITCHWIDPVTLRRRSVALACKCFGCSSKIFLTEKYLKQTLKSYNVPKHKVTSNVTENVYNFCKLFRDLNVPTISKTDTIDESSKLPYQVTENMDLEPYICYTKELSLIATIDIYDVIKSYHSLGDTYEYIFKKVFLFLFLASSDARLAPLLADLKKPEVVKWNSIYNSLAYFLQLEKKHSLAELLELVNIEPFTGEQMDYLSEYVNSLGPLASAFDRLQCEQGSYHGFILPTLLEMRKKCEKILKNNDLCKFRPFLHTIISKSSYRFYDFFTSGPKSDSVIIASVSHPQFKDKWVSAIDELQIDTVTSIFIKTVINENSKINDARIDVQEEDKSEEIIDDFYFGENEKNPLKKNTRTKLSFELEALKYLEDDRTNLKMLDDYPAVKRVFLKYNTSLSSSEAVEKIFPYEIRQNIARYGCLGEKYFEESVLCNVNKDVLVW